ncbi:hypothetical protein [Nostoc sp.]
MALAGTGIRGEWGVGGDEGDEGDEGENSSSLYHVPYALCPIPHSPFSIPTPYSLLPTPHSPKLCGLNLKKRSLVSIFLLIGLVSER